MSTSLEATQAQPSTTTPQTIGCETEKVILALARQFGITSSDDFVILRRLFAQAREPLENKIGDLLNRLEKAEDNFMERMDKAIRAKGVEWCDCDDYDGDPAEVIGNYFAERIQAREPLVKDKERLDWLESHTYHGKQSPSPWANGLAVHQVQDIWTQPGLNLREAVDEVRAALTRTKET